MENFFSEQQLIDALQEVKETFNEYEFIESKEIQEGEIEFLTNLNYNNEREIT